MSRAARVDVAYLAERSDDAVPVLLEELSSLLAHLRRPLAAALLERADRTDDWRSFNVSRARAHALLTDHREELAAFAR